MKQRVFHQSKINAVQATWMPWTIVFLVVAAYYRSRSQDPRFRMLEGTMLIGVHSASY